MSRANLSTNSQCLTDRQRRLLKAQLCRCYRDVPYYQHIFDQIKFDHRNITHVSDLQRLPTLSKEQIRHDYKDFISVKYNMENCKHSYSSGSTGEPFAAYFDNASWYRKKYWLKFRARFACGMSFGDRVALLECIPEDKSQHRNKHARLKDFFLKIRVFSMFMDPELLLARLRQFQPENIFAHPSHLMQLASTISDDESKLAGVERIFTVSEFLSAGSRQYIEQTFNAPIYDHYGCAELKEVAWQCPLSAPGSGYHINKNEVICEIVDSEGRPVANGVSGEIVVTDLRNRAMPLVRYRMNDPGVMTWQDCDCGYSGPSLLPLGGRSSDYIILPSLKQISPYLFTTNIENTEGLIQYQVDQLSATEVVARTVWESKPSAEQLQTVYNTVDRILDSSMTLTVEICDAISLESNGKLKVVKRSIELK